MRQDPIGGSREGHRVAVEMRSELCKNMFSSVCVCVSVCMYAGMDVSAASQGHSFEEFP